MKNSKGGRIEKFEEFKEGGYYSLVTFTPMGSTFGPLQFFISKIESDKNIVIQTASDEEGEGWSIAELKIMLDDEYRKLSLSSKEDFVKQLEETISEKEKKRDVLSKRILELNEFIAKLP